MEVATKLAEFHDNQGEFIKVSHLKYKHYTPVYDPKVIHSILCFQLCLSTFIVNPFSKAIGTEP